MPIADGAGQPDTCYHCGDPADMGISAHDKLFCCEGCRTVYEILQENQLDDYYTYEKTPGIKRQNSEDYLYLENETISDQLLDFKSDDYAKVTFFAPGIHCSSCIWLLENLHKLNPGVLSSRVHFVNKQVAVTFNPSALSLRDIACLMSDIGYPPLVTYEGTVKQYKSALTSTFIKLGVAAFCFGNIMLLSFPEYLGFHPSLEFQEVFTWLNFLLAVPVITYCGSDYITSAYKSLSRGHINLDVPISLGMLVLFVRSSWEVFSGIGPGFFDSLSGFVFFLLIGKWFQGKTYESLSFDRDFKSYFPLAVLKDTESGQYPAPVADLREGDHIFIRNNEILPVDAELLSTSASIDFSFVTGEEIPVIKQKGDLVYAGGRQKGPGASFKVLNAVSQGYLTSLWSENTDSKKDKTDYEQIIDKTGRYFTWVVLAIAIVTAIAWFFISPSKIWETVTAVLIVACPCALALSVPFTYGNILRVAGRNGLYLKSADVIEDFNNTRAIVFDKTGTLTDTEGGSVSFHHTGNIRPDMGLIKAMVKSSVHPLSRKVFQFLNNVGQSTITGQFAELPGLGLELEQDGKLIKLGTADFTGVPPIEEANSGACVYVSVDGHQAGHFIVRATYREGVGGMIQKLNKDYSLAVVSGDNDNEKPVLQKLFPENTPMHFNYGPAEKMAFVEEAEKERPVLMLGDGLNDAGALKSARVGLAVSNDLASFSPACKGIISGDKLGFLDVFISFFKGGKIIIAISFAISFLYNLLGVGFAVTGNLTPVFAAILMPVSSITVVAFATIAVNMLARMKKLK